MTNFITLDDMKSDDIYSLYKILSSTTANVSATVREIAIKWAEMLSSLYNKCYYNDKSFTLTFKGQDVSILLHLMNNYTQYFNGGNHIGMAKDILIICNKG